jgi:hypothetical protein
MYAIDFVEKKESRTSFPHPIILTEPLEEKQLLLLLDYMTTTGAESLRSIHNQADTRLSEFLL